MTKGTVAFQATPNVAGPKGKSNSQEALGQPQVTGCIAKSIFLSKIASAGRGRTGRHKCETPLSTDYIYVGGPKSNEKFFFGGVRGVSSVCSRLVRVRDCPPRNLAKRRPWEKVYRDSVIFSLSLCNCFRRYCYGRLKKTTCEHQVLFPVGENSSRN